MPDDPSADPSYVDPSYVVGVDFGTLSARAVVVAVDDGTEVGTGVCDYPHGVLDRALPDGTPLGPEWALQVPADYLHALSVAVPAALAAARVDPGAVVGLGLDCTASTMVPVLADGTPLADLPAYAGEPHAYAKLWKHRAAQPQADRVNALAAERREPWLARYGGLTSAEWAVPKGLQVLEEAPEVYAAMDLFTEAGDWLVWRLTGTLVRGAGAAGYKALRQDGDYPSRDLLAGLDPRFADFCDRLLAGPVTDLGARVGVLTEEAAAWTGLPAGTPVATANVDAHCAAVAAGAARPGVLVLIMGTSTCLVVNAVERRDAPGVAGVVDGGVTAGLWGYEAGQSAVGDVFGWFVDNAVPASYAAEAAAEGVSVHEVLTRRAERQAVGEHGLVALDWLGGNRSVLVDSELSGLVVGLTLTTRPEDVYRALIEATAFGARQIVDAYGVAGVPVGRVVAVGGLTTNRLLLRIYADVLGLPLETVDAGEIGARGAAIHAAVAADAWPDVASAADRMAARPSEVVEPDPAAVAAYAELHEHYRALHDHFGRGGTDLMHRLKAIRARGRRRGP